MREIKFRAWDTLGKGYINGFNMIGFSTGQGAPCKKLQRYSQVWQEPDSYILEQYTGLKDKNGKEIYRNDRVKSKHYGKGTIIWWGNGWAVESDDQGKDGIHFSLNYDFEVIGTIHDKEQQ